MGSGIGIRDRDPGSGAEDLGGWNPSRERSLAYSLYLVVACL